MTTPDAPPSLLGGRYQVGDRIGGGRLTDVFHGTDTQTGRAVALKILNADFVEDQAFAARFVQEAQLFAEEEQAAEEADRSNLVSILEAGNDGDTYWIAMELVSGATLAFLERQSPGPMDPARAIDIAIGVSNGLLFSHSHGVIHRDVTAHNILIGTDESGAEVIKLMDAGVARPTSATTAAQTAAALGSATYISPEIARGGEPFARSDLYSLGVVLYEMLTGRPPFTGDSPVAIAMAHVRETPKRPSESVPGMDPKLEAIVLKSLAKNPAERYASAEELRGDLRAARGSASSTTPQVAAEEPTEDPTAPLELSAAAAIAEADTMAYSSEAASKERRGLSLKVIVVACVVLAVVLGAIYAIVSSTSTILVPNLVGQRSAIAQSALQGSGLQVVVIESASDVDEPGIVLAQAPPAGQELTAGSSVTLTVSKAPGIIEVPSLIGLSRANAEANLASLGLNVGLVSTVASDLPPGEVLEQDPPALTQVGLGAEVNFSVAAGTVLTGVPNLTCLPVNQAGNQLKAAGLEMTIVAQEVNTQCQPGARIARQEPPPEGELPADGLVRVWTTEATTATTPSTSASPGVFPTDGSSPAASGPGKGNPSTSAPTNSPLFP